MSKDQAVEQAYSELLDAERFQMYEYGGYKRYKQTLEALDKAIDETEDKEDLDSLTWAYARAECEQYERAVFA